MGSKLGFHSQHIDALFPVGEPDSLDRLLRAAESARDMLVGPGWEAVVTLLGRKVEEIDRQLDGALLETRADYAHRHGQRAGLLALESSVKALIERAESRLEEQRAKHEDTAGSVSGG